LRALARATDGITAKVFSMFNELAVEAVRSRREQITDEDVESWKTNWDWNLTSAPIETEIDNLGGNLGALAPSSAAAC
jgi:hypothetical protein